MAKKPGRTRSCGEAEARSRLRQARLFLEAAELSAGDLGAEAANVAAANAVMAAIAAADAACCARLGYHAQGQDHADAIDHLAKITPGGKAASNALARSLAVKSRAQYGLGAVSGKDRDAAVKHARTLIAFAEKVLET